MRGENVSGEADGDAAGGIAVGKERIGCEAADARGTVQLRRLVEGRRFAAIRVAALLFLTAVEDAVSRADYGFLADVIGEADARADVQSYPTESGIDLTLPRAHIDVREQRRVSDAVRTV